MKTKIVFLLFFLGFCQFCVAQHDAIVIKKTDTTSTKQLDSIYKPAIGTKGIFQTKEEIQQIRILWTQMLSDFSDFLYDQKYHWRFNMELSCTAYFSTGKTVNYFIYDFDKNFLLPKDEETFVSLLHQFLQTYQLPFDTKSAFRISGSIYFD